MAEHYTDEDVEAAARTWWEGNGYDWSEHIEGEDKPHLLSEFRAVLDAVAPAIAARALREAADADWPWPAFSKASPHVMHSWLNTRADEIEGR